MSLSICACFAFAWPCLWPCLRPCRNLLEGWFRDWSIKDWTNSLSTRRDTNLRSESLALSTLSPPKSKLSISWELSNKLVKIPLGDAICRVQRITRVRIMCVLIFVCLGQKPQSEWSTTHFKPIYRWVNVRVNPVLTWGGDSQQYNCMIIWKSKKGVTKNQ